MVRGIYTGAMGMLVDMARLDTISNNLANVDTIGYKKDTPVFKAYLNRNVYMMDRKSQTIKPVKFIGNLEQAVILDEVRPAMVQGPIIHTGNKKDFAIDGLGFFVLRSPDGKLFYSRAGNFKTDNQNNLIDDNGNFVLDNEGNTVKWNEEYTVDENGWVYDKQNKKLFRFGIVRFSDPSKLEKYGYKLFLQTQESGIPVEDVDSKVMQGFIEGSNVNALNEMIKMISAMRHFEIAQRIITTEDQLLDRAVNSVGNIRG
ncbi:MAG TPA: flagellar basal-body rod protein FlgF [Thermotogaceae bacterium]|nr:flagellar basal-body rod protein FlgF [Thermotogaceae bacterium]